MALDAHTEQRNGKEVTVVKLHHQAPKPKYDDEDEEDMLATLALHYPQYTMQELYSGVPSYQVNAMWRALRKEQANDWLIFDTIVNAANTKDQKGYKKLMKELQKIANPNRHL